MLSVGDFCAQCHILILYLFLAEGLSDSQGDEAQESKIQISSLALDLLSIQTSPGPHQEM